LLDFEAEESLSEMLVSSFHFLLVMIAVIKSYPEPSYVRHESIEKFK